MRADRVPMDLGGLAWSITDTPPYGYRRLCEFIGLRNVTVAHRVGTYVVYPTDERVLTYFDVDFRHVRMGEPERELPGGIVEDAFGSQWKPTGSFYYPINPPLKDAKSPRDVEKYTRWPNPRDPVYVQELRREAKRFWEETDYAVEGDLGIARNNFHRYAQLRGFNQWLTDMRLNPELYEALADKVLEVNIGLMEAFLTEVGDYIQIVCVSDDMGYQAGPFLSVTDYRKYVKPWFKKYVKSIKQMASKVKVLYHSCGSVYPLIPDFIDCGVDILNPIQPLAKDMEASRLKHVFGEKLCFHGGIDVQRLLPFSKPDVVREQVTRFIKVMAAGGGYILAPSHELRGDIPPENIKAMYTAAREYALTA